MDTIQTRILLVAVVGILALVARPVSSQCMLYCDLDPGERDLCPETDPVPPNRVDTSEQLDDMREVMRESNITGAPDDLAAYLVYEGSYYGGGVTDHDKRMMHISGFSGSSGHVVVTSDQAALWTDGRYWLQADQEMDCNWILMKEKKPTSAHWLVDVLPENSLVGADPNYMATDTWMKYDAVFAYSGKNISLVAVPDLFHFIWTEEDGRPPITNNKIYEHTLDYSGVSWEDKVKKTVRPAFKDITEALVVTLLDDIAWMFNLRGSDRFDTPLFDSFAILTQDSQTLYIRDVDKLLPDVRDHLNTGSDGSCSNSDNCVQVKEYDDFLEDLEDLDDDMDAGKRIWINIGVSYAVYLSVSNEHKYEHYSPIQLEKSQKNPIEISNYKDCQIRDSSYLVEFIAMLEDQMVNQGRDNWTELNAAEELKNVRARDPNFRMVSFASISAIGSNGAIIHYMPTELTSQHLTTDDMYLLDSGGQYLDGTTDVTRTFHFGEPTDEQIEAYTRVLMGAIDLATTVWPFGWKGSDIDARTRTPIWQNGWDYNHGTGHGIGYFLNTHEGPGRINMGYDPSHSALYENMFFSDEPGIYLDNKFGVRLETIVQIVKADVPNHFNDRTYLTFEPVTFVPFEPKLINVDLLEASQIEWLNAYHQKCVDITGQYLLDNNKQQAYDWLVARTDDITTDAATSWKVSTPLAILVFIRGFVL